MVLPMISRILRSWLSLRGTFYGMNGKINSCWYQTCMLLLKQHVWNHALIHGSLVKSEIICMKETRFMSEQLVMGTQYSWPTKENYEIMLLKWLNKIKRSTLKTSIIRAAQIHESFGQSWPVLFQRSMKDRFQELWLRMTCIFSSRVFLIK